MIKKMIKAAILSVSFLFFRLLPIKANKMIFFALDKNYSDNPKYISKELLKLSKYKNKDIDIVWAVKNSKDKKNIGIKMIEHMSFFHLYHLATAKVWVSNYRKPFLLKKKKNQIYVQTWHGTPLKKIEKDVADKLSRVYKLSAKIDSNDCNVLISGNKHTTNIYRSSFWYDGEVLESGTPRNDIFYKNDHSLKEKIRNSICISNKSKIVTYAPTFRGNCERTIPPIDINRIISNLERDGEEWTFLLRLHPNIASDFDISNVSVNNSVRLIDVSDYPDMPEILYITDLFITDYSSTMFDFSLTRKPCVLYTYDADSYMNSDRGVYFKLEELPYPKAMNMDELVKEIIEFNEEVYHEKLDDFFEQIGNCEKGNAASAISEYIIKHL